MTNLEIRLTLIIGVLILTICTMSIIWFRQLQSLSDENKRLKRTLSAVKEANTRQKQKNEIDALKHQAALDRTMHMWREDTDELREQLAFKEMLLQQKWKVANVRVSK